MDALRAWLEHCVADHGVDPMVFGLLYLGKSVIYYYLLYRVVGSIRRKHWAPVPTWILLCVIVNMAPWLYVYLYGRNLPTWFHGLAALVLASTALFLGRSINRRLRNRPVEVVPVG